VSSNIAIDSVTSAVAGISAPIALMTPDSA
jgi:hypothetical protein